MTRARLLLTLLPFVLLGGCKNETPAATDATATSMQEVVEGVAQEAADAGALPAGDAPLEPGQSVQGTIEADVGKGSQSFRSLSTKLADDLDKQVAAKMEGNDKVQAAIDDGNAKLKQLGTDARVSADDVKDFVGGLAGKTIHDSHVMHVGIIKRQSVNIEGRAADGSKLQLSLNFDDKSLAFQDASFSYQPDPKSIMDRFSSDSPEVNIERFEKNADGSFALAGSFKATNVPAAVIAKKLKGKTLAAASGTFAFDALPAKEMPKFGR